MTSNTTNLTLLTGGGADQPSFAGASAAATPGDVAEALRNYDNPLELARSPLAAGRTPGERAASVRSLLHEAAHSAFGASPNEELLRTVIARGYLSADTTHEALADELFLSRSTYFRKLRHASARIADYVTWSPTSSDPSSAAA